MGKSVHFTEEMAGFVNLGSPDYAAGYHNGKAAGTRLKFHLTIGTHDLDSFLADPQHLCAAMGYVAAPMFGGEHLPVVRGKFNLFAPGQSAGRTVMRYRLWFFSGDSGEPLTLVGFKDVGNDPGLDAWRDTTCLFTRILEGHVEPEEDETATERARGLILIEPKMFARSLAKVYWSRPRSGRAS